MLKEKEKGKAEKPLMKPRRRFRGEGGPQAEMGFGSHRCRKLFRREYARRPKNKPRTTVKRKPKYESSEEIG